MTSPNKLRRDDPARLMRPAEAARLLGVHPDTLARWADEGEPEQIAKAAVRLPSGHRRYIARAIHAYLRELAERAA